ncbi:MAG: glutamate-cysteine ligase family protein [bacterium]
MIEHPVNYLINKFKDIEIKRDCINKGRRIGSKLAFPLVLPDGRAGDTIKNGALWDFLCEKGWKKVIDPISGETISVRCQGEKNDHVVSCKLSFCRIEFSLAHTDNLFNLSCIIEKMQELIREFEEKFHVSFLGFGLQPITPPSQSLLLKNKKDSIRYRIFGKDSHVYSPKGPKHHLFAINASNQVHVDVTMDEAISAINVFNGLAGFQVALTANSNIWQGRIDREFKSLAEVFGDFVLQDKRPLRYGVPERKFRDLEDYFLFLLSFPPGYIERDGILIRLPHCPSFLDYCLCNALYMQCMKGRLTQGCCGITESGEDIKVKMQTKDLYQHFSFFWPSARLSRYYTLENRINDQQPPGEMMTIPALTLGIIENLNEAERFIDEYPWPLLGVLRIKAARFGLEAKLQGVPIWHLCKRMVDIAEDGLKKRGLGEELFLIPLKERIEKVFCPADKAAQLYRKRGIQGFLKEFTIK